MCENLKRSVSEDRQDKSSSSSASSPPSTQESSSHSSQHDYDLGPKAREILIAAMTNYTFWELNARDEPNDAILGLLKYGHRAFKDYSDRELVEAMNNAMNELNAP